MILQIIDYNFEYFAVGGYNLPDSEKVKTKYKTILTNFQILFSESKRKKLIYTFMNRLFLKRHVEESWSTIKCQEKWIVENSAYT